MPQQVHRGTLMALHPVTWAEWPATAATDGKLQRSALPGTLARRAALGICPA
jgi:hypothetical protein